MLRGVCNKIGRTAALRISSVSAWLPHGPVLRGSSSSLRRNVQLVPLSVGNALAFKIRAFSTPSRDAPTIQTVQIGEKETLEHRIFFEDSQGLISPWHDIPLFPPRGKGLLNCVIEIARGTRAKMEIAVKEVGNPIMQDTKKDKLRYYGIDPVFNYGAFPQTWEDPNTKHEEANCVGDGDPIDVVEIGSAVIPTGSLVQVKPLGVLCMIDDGEADWKVLAIAAGDPLFDKLNDIGDVEKHLPGKVSEVREWFRIYKTHEGKPLNKFGLNEEALGKDYTMKIILRGFADWARLRSGLVEAGKFKLD